MLDLETSLDLCTYCPRLCSHTCPVSTASGRETLTPQAKMARFAVRHHQRQAEHEAEGPQTSPLPLYGCTGCGACTSACLHQVEPANVLLHGRAEARAGNHAGGHPALLDLPERHRRRAAAAAASLAKDDELRKRFAAADEVALLPACLPRQGDGPAREAQTILRVCDRLQKADSSFPRIGLAALSPSEGAAERRLGSGGCAGYPLYAGGFLESFRLYAESFARSVEKYATLAVSCSACTWLLRSQYQQFGVPLRPRILHTSELLAPHAGALPITRPLSSASYHDPCHLGRRLGCYEPPRQLLRPAVLSLHELPLHRNDARCCGSGGLLPTTEPDLARAMAALRLDETDAQLGPLITACPACQTHLAHKSPVPVRDLFDILDEATT